MPWGAGRYPMLPWVRATVPPDFGGLMQGYGAYGRYGSHYGAYGTPGQGSATVQAGGVSMDVVSNGVGGSYGPAAQAPPVVPVAIESGSATDGQIIDENGDMEDGNFSAGFPTFFEEGPVGDAYRQTRSWLQRDTVLFGFAVPNWLLALGGAFTAYKLIK